VTRIIAGAAGGIRLDVPASGTRPTSDRVRESLFGALDSAGALEGARVLDLYAGSGALGLEAFSRGAAAVELVERDAGAARVARANAARVAAATGRPAARVHRAEVASFLRSASGPYDLVLADPPYAIADDELAATLSATAPLLARGGVAVVERAARSAAPPATTGMFVERDKRYGDTAVWWLRRA